MQDEGFTQVAVQSLHTIGGAEYHDLRRTVGAFKVMGGFQRIILGYPLLATQEDMLTEQRKRFSETFIVWSDKINLVGSIIPSNKGKASILGTIKFKNGEKLSFKKNSPMLN